MKKCTKKIPKHNAGAIVGNSLNFVGDMTQNVVRSQNEGVSFGSVLGGMGKGAATGAALGSVIPGIGTVIGGIGGAIVGGITSAVGQSGSVDENTGKVTKSSGLTRLFGWGRDDEALYAKSNRIITSNVDKQLTPYMNYKFMSDPYNHLNTNVYVNAAEGGIMRTPVEALVSKGELIYNPVTKKLSQVPGSKGKPNKADDVYTRLYEGDVVISNSPTMLMANGKTPAQNLMGMVDKYATGGTVKAREAIIKKVVNWQEANKTKPQEYAMYDEGTGKVKVRKKEKIKYVVWNDKFGYFDAEGGFHDMRDIPNQNLPDSAYLGRYEWVDAPTKNENVGKHTSTELDFNTSRHTRDGVNDKKPESNWRKSPTQEEIDAFYGSDRKKVSETVVKDRSERINNKNRKYLVENQNENEMTGALPEVMVTAKKINKKGKQASKQTTPSAKKVESRSTQPVEFNEQMIAQAKQDADKLMSQYYDNTAPLLNLSAKPTSRAITPVNATVEDEIVNESPVPQYTKPTGSESNKLNWGDLAYKAAVLTQPLWGRAKAEPVNYDLPYVNFVPTSIDVTSDLTNIDRNAAAARYDLANRYRNTGAGLAATLQLAQNRSAQQSAIRQWQTNAQNELIGKNVGIYNDWSKTRTGIMNDVYDKVAQNKAAARNINRQNMSAMLGNWGQISRDGKLLNMQKGVLNMYAPAIKAVMEDPYSVLNPLYNLNS